MKRAVVTFHAVHQGATKYRGLTSRSPPLGKVPSLSSPLKKLIRRYTQPCPDASYFSLSESTPLMLECQRVHYAVASIFTSRHATLYSLWTGHVTRQHTGHGNSRPRFKVLRSPAALCHSLFYVNVYLQALPRISIRRSILSRTQYAIGFLHSCYAMTVICWLVLLGFN